MKCEGCGDELPRIVKAGTRFCSGMCRGRRHVQERLARAAERRKLVRMKLAAKGFNLA